MQKYLGVVMDSIESLNYQKDTTLALLLAAQEHGYLLFYMQQKDLFIDNNGPQGKMTPLIKIQINGMPWGKPQQNLSQT